MKPAKNAKNAKTPRTPRMPVFLAFLAAHRVCRTKISGFGGEPEYPYERSAGDWTTPALEGFAATEVERARALAGRLFTSARAIVTALRR